MGAIARKLEGKAKDFAQKNLRTEEIRGLNQNIAHTARKAFSQVKSSRQETFDQAVRRLGLSEADLEINRLTLEREQKINFVLLAVSFLFLCASTFSIRPMAHFLLALAIMAYLTVRMVGTDFKLFRNRHRMLVDFWCYLSARKQELLGDDVALEMAEVEPAFIEETPERDPDVLRSRDEANLLIQVGSSDEILRRLLATFAETYVRPNEEEDKVAALYYRYAGVMARAYVPVVVEVRDMLFSKQRFGVDEFLKLCSAAAMLSIMHGRNPFREEDLFISPENRHLIKAFMDEVPDFRVEDGVSQKSENFRDIYKGLLDLWRDALEFPASESERTEDGVEISLAKDGA